MILALAPASAHPAPALPTPCPAGQDARLTSVELAEAIAAESHTIRLAIASGFGCLTANAAGDAVYAATAARFRARRLLTVADDAPAELPDLDPVPAEDRDWWAAESRRLADRAAMRAYHLATADRDFDLEADVARYRNRHVAGLTF